TDLAAITKFRKLTLGSEPGLTSSIAPTTTNGDLTGSSAFPCDVTINSGATLTVSNVLNAGTHTLFLNSGTSVMPLPGGMLKAANLALQSVSGLGFVNDPFVTAVGHLAASTGRYGPYIQNTGSLTIGFAGEPFTGVVDTGAAAAIQGGDANIGITTS